MAQSRSNPRSTQFTGKLPPELLLAGVEVALKPTPEWSAANPTRPGEVPAQPGEADQMACIMLTVQRVIPSALFRGEPERWAQSDNRAIGQLMVMGADGQVYPAIMPLANFRELTPIGGQTSAPVTPSALEVVGDAKPPWGDA